MVDARAGPGIKSTTKLKSKQQLSPTTGKYKSPLKTRKSLYSTPSSSPTSFFDDTSSKDILFFYGKKVVKIFYLILGMKNLSL